MNAKESSVSWKEVLPDGSFNLQKRMKNVGNSKCAGKHERFLLISLRYSY